MRRRIAAGAVSVAFLLPLVLLVSGSLREPGPPPPIPELIPSRLTFDNYVSAFEIADLGAGMLNSILVAAVAVPASVVVAAAAGFGASRLQDSVGRAIVVISLIALVIPATALVVGRFAMFRAIGVTDSFLPLIATALIGGSPLNVLVFYWSFRQVPTELFDAARLDGASPLTTLFQIAWPLVGAVTLAVGLITFVGVWSNVLEPLVYLSDQDLFTLPLHLRTLAALDAAQQPIMLAGAVIALFVPVLGFLAVQSRVFGHWFQQHDDVGSPAPH